MDSELIKLLAGLGAVGIAAMAVMIVAWALLFRTKSDNKTASNQYIVTKELLTLLADSYKTIGDGINSHTIESTTRHLEVLGGFQTVQKQFSNVADTMKSIKSGLVSTLAEHDTIIKSVNDLSAEVGAYREKVKEVGGGIVNEVSKIDKILDELIALRRDVQGLKETVTTKTQQYEERIDVLEVSVKSLQPTEEAPKLETKPKTETVSNEEEDKTA
jgi:uncharacterized coiled-coil DUF342 family protein